MNKIILVVCGDPNSVNSEIIFKVWKKINSRLKEKIFFIGSYELIKSQFKKLKYNTNLLKLQKASGKSNKLKIIDIPLNFKKPFNVSKKEASKYVLKSLDKAHALASNQIVKGLINCPIDKKLLSRSKDIGVTEYLASKCRIKNNSDILLQSNYFHQSDLAGLANKQFDSKINFDRNVE